MLAQGVTTSLLDINFLWMALVVMNYRNCCLCHHHHHEHIGCVSKSPVFLVVLMAAIMAIVAGIGQLVYSREISRLWVVLFGARETPPTITLKTPTRASITLYHRQ
jgi:hypothetical protein